MKNKAAQELGKLGGKAGTGKSKIRTTSFDKGSARKAAQARWNKPQPKTPTTDE